MCGPFLADDGIIAAILLRIILLSELSFGPCRLFSIRFRGNYRLFCNIYVLNIKCKSAFSATAPLSSSHRHLRQAAHSKSELSSVVNPNLLACS